MPLARKSSESSSRTPTRERSLKIHHPNFNDGISEPTFIATSHSRRTETPESAHQSTSSGRDLRRPISSDCHPSRNSSRIDDPYIRDTFDGETLAGDPEKPLPEVPVSPLQIPLPFQDSKFDQSRETDDDLPQYYHSMDPRDTIYARRYSNRSSFYPDTEDKGHEGGVGHLEAGRRIFEDVTSRPRPASPQLLARKRKDETYASGLVDVSFNSSTPEEFEKSSDMAEKPSNGAMSKRKLQLCWATFILAALVVVIGVITGSLSYVKHGSGDNQDKATMESETFSASSTPLLTESPASERVTNAALSTEHVPTSVVVVTSSIETSETPSSTPTPTPTHTPTPTSTLESSSVQSSSSLSSPSSPSSNFMQSTAVLEDLVGRSGYLDQRADGSLRYDSLLDLDQGGYLGPREDPEDCEDVTITITTTLTTTITSTIRTSRMVASSAGSDSASPQPPEPEPAETGPKCITNTIYHTDGLPISTDTWDDTDIPSKEVSSVAADSTASPDTTPLPTETSATLSAGEETGVVSTSSVAQAERLAVPNLGNSLLCLRRFLPLFPRDNEQNRHLLPSLIIPTATTKNNDADNGYSVKVLSTTSSNAAVRREAQHWNFMGKPNPAVPSRIHERREVPAQPPSLPGTEVMKTYWEAYWDFRLLIIQMCFSVKSETPPTLGDVKMGETLNKTICDTFEQEFPAINEGAKCDHKDSFERLNNIVKALCALAKEGEKYVQSLALLCHVQDTLKGKVYECGVEEGGVVSGTGTMIAASLMETFDSGPSITKEEPAPSADVEVTPDSGQIASDVPSFSLQQNAVENADPPPVGPSVSPVALASEPPLVTSAASLLPSPVPPTPPIPGNSPVSTPPTPATGLGVLPPHPSLTPPAEWTVSMLTYSTQAANYSSLRTMPSNAVGTPPVYEGPHLARDWPVSYPFAIPTGYVAPNIVPADPQVGQLTLFEEGVGACGLPGMIATDFAVAINWEIFDIGREIGGSILEDGWKSEGVTPDGKLVNWPKDDSSSALCNQGIRAWMADDEGKKLVEQEFVVRDRCAACNVSDLDIQKSVFTNYWGAEAEGRIQVTWEWMQEAPTDVPG